MESSGAEDRPVRIESEGRQIAGMLHLPAGEMGGPGVVFCNAFGDERKSSCLAMVRLARRLAAEGLPVLRFDYWGCGDSPGDFVDATVSTRLEDIAAAARFLPAHTGGNALCLLGLRLGAALAALVAEDLDGCAGLALIEVVSEGAAYVRGLEQRTLVRKMISGPGRGTPQAPPEVVDLDGYAVRRSVLDEVQRLGIRVGGVAFRGPVLVVQVSFNEKLTSETAAVRETYAAAGARVDLRTLVLPPFWRRVEVTDTTVLDGTVAAWLQTLRG